MLLIDLDETLLNDKGEIPDINSEAIKQAYQKGIKIVLCSGRSNMSLKKFIDNLGVSKDGYAIAFNGGIIYKTDTNEIISEHLLNDDYAREIIEKCRKYDVHIMMYCNQKLWIDRCTQKIEDYANKSKLVPVLVDNLINATVQPVSKVIIIGKNRILKVVEEDFKNEGWNNKISTFFSSERLYEFNPLGIDKGSGLRELANYLNIDIKDVIAIGDNYNDISMIQTAGLGIAVKNANDEIKSIADYVTERDNNEGAVAEVIEKYILAE